MRASSFVLAGVRVFYPPAIHGKTPRRVARLASPIDMLGAVFCVLLPVAFVDRAKLHVQTMPHGQVLVDRAAGLRRLQQPDSPVQDPTPCPLQDNDTAVAFYGGPHGLYTCGDVATALACSHFIPACPQSCGVCDCYALSQDNDAQVAIAAAAARAARSSDSSGGEVSSEDVEASSGEGEAALDGGSFELNTCGDVVAGGQCSSFLQQCPHSCGVCDGTADLTQFCHCFEVGWTFDSECRGYAATILPAAKRQCGAEWYDSRATDMETINSVMATWDGSYTLSYAVSMGAFFIGDGPKFFSVFRAQHPMTGLLVMSLKAEDFHNMGFSVREANDIFKGLDDFNFKQYRGAPFDTYATYAALCLEPRARGPRLRLLTCACVRLRCRVGTTHPAQCGPHLPWGGPGRSWSSIQSRCQSRSFSKP